jgi:hypothetical protein
MLFVRIQMRGIVPMKTTFATLVGVLGLPLAVACGGSDGAVDVPAESPSAPPSPTGGGSSSSSGQLPAPPADLPAPVAVAKTFEREPGTTVIATLEAQGATDTTFEIVTPPTKGRVAWIDAKKGELVYWPTSIASGAPDELSYVVKGNGKTSAPARVVFALKPLDFTKVLAVRGARQSWYSYNLAANFNNGGSSDCGAEQTLTIANGKLLERAWPCGTLPEIAISIGAGSANGGTSSAGGSFRKVEIARRQLDARLEYREQSTQCSSYNSTLNTCNAGLSEDTTGRVYFGAVPATNTAPIVRPTTCETTAGKLCDGIFAATDPEHDPLSFQIVKPPQNGQAAPNAELKTFGYMPKAGFVGTDTFDVVASDDALTSAPVTITIVVK